MNAPYPPETVAPDSVRPLALRRLHSSLPPSYVSTVVGSFVLGVLTQTRTWAWVERSFGIGYPHPIVDLLDSSSVYASLAFAGAAVVRPGAGRWRVLRSVVAGVVVQFAAFAGYYAVYDWSSGSRTGAASWLLLAVVTGPFAAWLGYLWRSGRSWVLGGPLGFFLTDAVLTLGLTPVYDDARQYQVVLSFGIVVLVVGVLGAPATRRDRLLLLVATGASAVVLCAAFLSVFDDTLRLIGL